MIEARFVATQGFNSAGFKFCGKIEICSLSRPSLTVKSAVS
jgi:hypothetical protein